MIFKPENEHILEIEKWLKDEYNLENDGFYSNWEIIYDSYKENRMIVINENNYPIGFLVYKIDEYVANIMIASIKLNKRRKGIGKIFIDNCCEYFKSIGAYVVELFCSPVESENAWKKFGFLNFPKGVTKEGRIYLYKILVPTLPEINDEGSFEKIQLWDKELYMTENYPPKWTWKVERLSSNQKKLTKPIIHPANYKWGISWSKGSEIVEKGRVENFNLKGVDFGSFMIINEL